MRVGEVIEMTARQRYLNYVNKLGACGFINFEEHTDITNRINTRFNAMGWK
jgi:hypothetical protein